MGSAAMHTIILIVTTIFAKLLGFAREMALAYSFGATAVSDAYVVAFSIPTIVFAGIGTAVMTSYIPISTALGQNAPEEQKRFHNNVVTMVLLLSLAVLGIFQLFDTFIVKLFALGFEGETLELAVSLSRVMIISIVFIGVYFIIQGYLQMRGRFFAVGMVSVPLNICVIATILLADKIGAGWLGWGVVAGYGASYLMLYLSAKKAGYSYRPSFRFRDENIKRMLLMVIPIFVSKTIHQLNVMLDRTLASTLVEGSVSSISYGNRVIGFVTSVFVVSITTAIFPKLSKFSVENDTRRLKKMVSASIGMMSALVVPLSAGAMIFSKEIVSVLFLRGAFTEAAAEMTARVVLFYAVGLLFYSIKDIMLNAFYAMGDSKTPTVNSVVSLVINVLLNLLLMKKMGSAGLALATSISGFITMIMMAWSLRKRVGQLGLRALAVSLAKMGAATLVMSLAVMPLYDLLFLNTESMLLSLLVSVAAGAVIYFVVAALLKTREIGLLVVGVYDKLKSLKKR